MSEWIDESKKMASPRGEKGRDLRAGGAQRFLSAHPEAGRSVGQSRNTKAGEEKKRKRKEKETRKKKKKRQTRDERLRRTLCHWDPDSRIRLSIHV